MEEQTKAALRDRLDILLAACKFCISQIDHRAPKTGDIIMLTVLREAVEKASLDGGDAIITQRNQLLAALKDIAVAVENPKSVNTEMASLSDRVSRVARAAIARAEGRVI